MTFHKDMAGTDVHALIAVTYTDLAARDADTVFQVSTNVNKMVRIDNPVSYHILTSVGPTVWAGTVGGAATNFLALLDTPAQGAYVMQAGRVIEVNPAEDGLQFGQVLTSIGLPVFAGLLITGNATISGDLIVNGTRTIINSTILEVDDKNIELGSIATPTDITADGGGITLKGDTDKTILWTSLTQSWDFNQQVIAQVGLQVIGYLNNFGLSGDPDSFAAGPGALGSTTSGVRNVVIGKNAGRSLLTGSDNCFLGVGAGSSATSSNFNVGVGKSSLTSLTTGDNNVAVGEQTLQAVKTTNRNTALGTDALKKHVANDTVAVGFNALVNNTGGILNTALGFEALGNNVSNDGNTAVGHHALKFSIADFNTAVGADAMAASNGQTALASENVAVGAGALNLLATGNQNVAVGRLAMGVATNAKSNVAMGYKALGADIGGDFNVAIGHKALNSSLGNDNTAVGFRSLFNVTTGEQNTAVGCSALLTAATNTGNTAVGFNALLNTISDFNTAIGHGAMGAGLGTTLGGNNVAVGAGALNLVTSGSLNVAVGRLALTLGTVAKSNVAVGHLALTANIVGDFNVAIGDSALLSATGAGNIAIGFEALKNVTTGVSNTAIGDDVGFAIVTGSRNVLIGQNANFSTDVSDFLNIGNSMYLSMQSSNFLGLGVESPQHSIHIQRAGQTQLVLETFSASTANSTISLRKSDSGTVGVDAAVDLGDIIGEIDFSGNDGFGFARGARIHATAEETFTATSGAMALRFFTAPSEGNTAERMTINSSGTVEMIGPQGLIVGGFSSGSLQIRNKSAAAFSSAAITGHNSIGGNTQLWYLGSSSGGNDDVTFNNRRNGALFFSTNSIARLRVEAGGNIVHTNFTFLGSNAPGIKMKLLTGVSASSAGSAVNITHGLNIAKVVSFQVTIAAANGGRFGPGYLTAAGGENWRFSTWMNPTVIAVVNDNSSTSEIHTKAITILVTYLEG